MLWWPKYWSEGHQTLAQFLFYSDNWYSKCFEPKGCPKKNLKYVFWSRGQKSKFQTWSNCAEILHGLVGYQYKLFLFSGPYWFRPLFRSYGLFKEKNVNIFEMEPDVKKCHCVKQSQNSILHLSMWFSKKFEFFPKKLFWDTL